MLIPRKSSAAAAWVESATEPESRRPIGSIANGNGRLTEADAAREKESYYFPYPAHPQSLRRPGPSREFSIAAESYENPIAERVNGILKEELLRPGYPDHASAKMAIAKAI